MASGEGQAGYTLTEMLAALLIVGLAMGGLVEGGFAISRLQVASGGHIAAFDSGRRVQARLVELLDERGPFRSTGGEFEGDANGFHFPCGSLACGAGLHPSGAAGTTLSLVTPTVEVLPLGHVVAPHFLYVGSATTQMSWPPTGTQAQRLQSVRLVSGQGEDVRALASARLWRQEEASCSFDPIRKDCRMATP